VLKFIKNLKRFLLTDPWHCDSSWCTFDIKTEEPVEEPIYFILDPHQNMKCSVMELYSQITGPFHSKDSAEDYLSKNKFSKRATVVAFTYFVS